MLRAIAKEAVRLAPRVEVAAVTQRGMALEGVKGEPTIRGWVCARPPRPPDPAPQRPRPRRRCAGYPDKEAAAEAVFFHKEDERLLKSLLSKVRAQAERHDPHNATGARAAELSALNELVGSKLSQAEKDGERWNWGTSAIAIACPARPIAREYAGFSTLMSPPPPPLLQRCWSGSTSTFELRGSDGE
jgi:hypothetical protein